MPTPKPSPRDRIDLLPEPVPFGYLPTRPADLDDLPAPRLPVGEATELSDGVDEYFRAVDDHMRRGG